MGGRSLRHIQPLANDWRLWREATFFGGEIPNKIWHLEVKHWPNLPASSGRARLADQIESHIRRLEVAERPAINEGLLFEFSPSSAHGPAEYEAFIKEEIERQLKEWGYTPKEIEDYLKDMVKVVKRQLSDYD